MGTKLLVGEEHRNQTSDIGTSTSDSRGWCCKQHRAEFKPHGRIWPHGCFVSAAPICSGKGICLGAWCVCLCLCVCLIKKLFREAVTEISSLTQLHHQNQLQRLSKASNDSSNSSKGFSIKNARTTLRMKRTVPVKFSICQYIGADGREENLQSTKGRKSISAKPIVLCQETNQVDIGSHAET